MGAEVIKIKTPGEGDPVRQQGAIREGLSWYFAGFNRNKRSLTLDLRQDAGREILSQLIARGDVLVENFRPGVLQPIGFDETRLKALNPRLVCCHITGFGESGPYRDRPSFDFIAQAMSGFMSMTGNPMARRCALARRSAIRSPGFMRHSAFAVPWCVVAEPDAATRGCESQQWHDQHAGLSRRELSRDRRAAAPRRQ